MTIKRQRDIKDGDKLWVHGYLMQVSNVRVAWTRPDGLKVIRYEGKMVGGDLVGSGYDGATYGQVENALACVEE